MKKRIVLLSALAAMAGCSSPPPAPEPAPPPAPEPPPPTPTVDWTEWPLASGQWVYRQDDEGSIALFGETGSDARFTIRCERDGFRIILSRAGSLPGQSGQMTLRTHSGVQGIAARNDGGAAGYVVAELSPRDLVLDRIAFSRGRFAVEAPGLPGIAIPARPEFARVVEDCRS